MSFAALALRARAANDTTRAQINNIPSKSHVIPLLSYKDTKKWLENNFTSHILQVLHAWLSGCVRIMIIMCCDLLKEGHVTPCMMLSSVE